MLSACFSAELTHCPEVDCPKEMVCDGHGGCALPEQLSTCAGQADGTLCSYRDRTNATIAGSCGAGLCVPVNCGNGAMSPDEKCDDGNNNSGDGCSADCLSLETCGNGITDSATGEQCDDGANVDGDGCQQDCKLPRCGDGVRDSSLDEACDAGDANSSSPDAACRPNCQLPRCGDGVTDPSQSEKCDDGNNASADGCSGDCKSNESCGNNIVDALAGEQCDDGNTMGGDGCSANCRSVEVCGNGVTDTMFGEVCDDGNTVSGDGCSSDCRSLETCGNGIIDTINEQCDLGAANSNLPDSACRTNCKLPKCGDEIRDPQHGEQCDDGMMNADVADACRTNCQLPRCGDTIKDMMEVCDDGNTIAGDNCSSDCRSLEVCGNGIIDVAKNEQCDDGNMVNADGCHNNCTLPRCGDGVLDVNEQCDNGSANSNSPNATCRTTCVPQRCGDGILDNTLGEVCDDSNNASGDGCSGNCRSNETCGNGVVDPQQGELCDDGNTRGRDGCSGCDPETALVLRPGTAAPKRHSEVLVYDAARQRVVMFGGLTADGWLGDTWEWDGVSWTQKFPKHAPSPRFDAQAAYDPVRKRVLLFGGYTANYGFLVQDTWEYDGVDWTQRFPVTVPPSRAAGAMAFDGVSRKMLMFGGDSTSINFQNDTWHWDGTNWTLLAPTTKPGTRRGVSMAWDAAKRYVVLFGGEPTTGSNDNHVWTWTGTNWVDCGATSGPATGASLTALTYDAERGKVVAWGGGTNTYEWSGTTACAGSGGWTAVAGGPTTPRGYMPLTYDAARKQVVGFGGAMDTSEHPPPDDTDAYADTWLRTGTTWSNPAPFTQPSARMRAGLGYDPARKKTVLFGGQGAGSELADTWEWDGRRWSSVAATMPPSARAGQVIDYDAAARTIRLYGGDTTSTAFTDVYNFSGTGWSLQSSSGRASARGATMSYDAAANRLVTFGGLSSGTTPTNQTWTWSATGGWTQATPTMSPAPRDETSTAYDPVRQRTVVFSGDPRNGNTLIDVWEWTGASWNQVTASGPSQRVGHRLYYNPDAARVCVFGANTTGSNEDLWEWDGSDWLQRPLTNTINSRYQSAAAYDAASRALVVFGGRDASATLTQATALIQYTPNSSIESCTSSLVDYDKDGKAGCVDDECWGVCDPLHPPGTTRPAGAPFCGDTVCNPSEDCRICPGDCGQCTGGKCGDFHCDTNASETSTNCPTDC